MLTALFIVAALAVGFGAGWFGRVLAPGQTTAPPRRSEPYVDHDDYTRRAEQLTRAYTDSMKEYDRLVTWASAGALGLSIGFVDKFGQHADRSTVWMLGAGWTLLIGSFSLSLWSQYFSSRIHSYRRRELEHIQQPRAERSATWAGEAVRLDRIAKVHGWTTKVFTFVSGLLLMGGFMFVSRFAYVNVAPALAAAPTKSARADTLERRPVTVPEKKGLEDLPEPRPRPTNQPTTSKPTKGSGKQK